jgi:hypothetical protein
MGDPDGPIYLERTCEEEFEYIGLKPRKRSVWSDIALRIKIFP